MRSKLTTATLTLIIAAATLTPATAAPATPAAGPNCTPLLAQATHGKAAVSALGANLTAAAARNGKSAEQLRTLLADESLWLDTCGLAYYVEEKAPSTASTEVAPAAPFPYSDTFLLHSKPGSSRTIYLDFDGATISSTYGGAWLSYNGGNSFFATPYDSDGNPNNWSTTEQDNIQDIWRRVAEDYAAFDVDVTTEAPAASALERSSTSDTVYGTTALITNDNYVGGSCGCGGVAYVGVYDATGTTHEYYQPAWVVTRGVGTGSKYVAEATSHEVGHNLGLSHDGTSTVGYYQGVSGQGWAPIMGVGYYQPLVTWSRGEYPSANNTEDDYTVIAANGVNTRADEDTNNTAGALSVSVGSPATGIISTRTDTDWFALTPTATGSYTINANPAALSPNLDIQLDLYDSTSNLIATSNPTMAYVNGDTASGMNAFTTQILTGGQTYYIKLDGVGKGTWTTGADYNDYGSLGQYTVSVTTPLLSVATGTLPAATLNTAYSTTVQAAGGTPSYAYSATGLPAGLTINSATGAITGTPTATGTSSVVVTVTDATSGTATATLSLRVAAAPSISTSTLANGAVGTSYSATVAASGGVTPYVWSATGMPNGLSVSSSTGAISGTPSAAGTFNPSFTVTEANGATANKTITIVVTTPPLAISTATLPSGTVGTAYSSTVAATGGSSPYSWSATGLPTGLSIGSSTGTISGTPSVGGNFSVTVTTTDSVAGSVSKTLSMTIAIPTLTITTASLPGGSRTANYSATLAASGGSGTRTWTRSAGTLPSGLTLSTGGVLSGRPTAKGTFKFTITVTDTSGRTASKAFQIRIA